MLFDIALIIAAGGATLNKNGETVTFSDGYQVSKKDCFILSASDILTVGQAITELLNGIEDNEFCGVWVENGFCYVDISERIEERETALQIGRERAQISVYDWAAADCVYC